MIRIAWAMLAAGLLAGCEKPVPVQPVTIKGSDFCDIMKATLPDSSGKPTWDVADTHRTIHDARRVGAAVDRRCVKQGVK